MPSLADKLKTLVRTAITGETPQQRLIKKIEITGVENTERSVVDVPYSEARAGWYGPDGMTTERFISEYALWNTMGTVGEIEGTTGGGHNEFDNRSFVDDVVDTYESFSEQTPGANNFYIVTQMERSSVPFGANGENTRAAFVLKPLDGEKTMRELADVTNRFREHVNIVLSDRYGGTSLDN